jgi:DinB superfamily
MHQATLSALATFPDLLEAHYAQIPAAYLNWAPPSWHGVPSEPFTPIEQICHLRDIEIDGYHVRLQRTPELPSIDSAALATARGYAAANAAQVLIAFRAARLQTVELIAGLAPRQLTRTAVFAEHGLVTLRSLVHYLCSHDQQHLAGLQWLLAGIESPAARS